VHTPLATLDFTPKAVWSEDATYDDEQFSPLETYDEGAFSPVFSPGADGEVVDLAELIRGPAHWEGHLSKGGVRVAGSDGKPHLLRAHLLADAHVVPPPLEDWPPELADEKTLGLDKLVVEGTRTHLDRVSAKFRKVCTVLVSAEGSSNLTTTYYSEERGKAAVVELPGAKGRMLYLAPPVADLCAWLGIDHANVPPGTLLGVLGPQLWKTSLVVGREDKDRPVDVVAGHVPGHFPMSSLPATLRTGKTYHPEREHLKWGDRLLGQLLAVAVCVLRYDPRHGSKGSGRASSNLQKLVHHMRDRRVGYFLHAMPGGEWVLVPLPGEEDQALAVVRHEDVATAALHRG